MSRQDPFRRGATLPAQAHETCTRGQEVTPIEADGLTDLRGPLRDGFGEAIQPAHKAGWRFQRGAGGAAGKRHQTGSSGPVHLFAAVSVVHD